MKYRHPFWPSRHFDAVLQSGRFSFDSLSARTLGDLLPQLGEECVIPYIRNDEDNWIETTRSPARYFQLWERTSPSWCVTPDHWVEPIPPPGYAVQHALPGPHPETYKKIPTLHISGTGRHILPAAKVPQIISRSLYIPVRTHNTTEFRVAPLQKEADLVPRGAHLIPGNISLDAARTLLGRVVQSSKEPLPDPDVPRAQRRKINKYAAQHLGFAWGLQTAADGSPSWLHCAYYADDGFGEYVIDLSGQKRQYQERSPIFIDTVLARGWARSSSLWTSRQSRKLELQARGQPSTKKLLRKKQPVAL
ncbi:hypothetical protein FKP32DRAFT_1001660 [Trametes sanguinea]|nr:hypothetical protein FKP32DRAFT_1001660 [Trametes sanguinea]